MLLTEDGVWQTLLKRKYIGLDISSDVETWGFTFLGWPNDYKEVFLPIWYYFDKRWFADTFLGGLLAR
jgi:hypothetical protein